MKSSLLLAALSLTALAACAPMQAPQQLDPSRLSSGGRQVMAWKPLVDADDTLNRTCLEQTTGVERQRKLESCFITPMREAAKSCDFPLKKELETYLEGVKKEVDTQTLVNAPESDFQLKVATHRDHLIVAIHRYLQATSDMFDGPASTFIGDDQVRRLKARATASFSQTSNINRLLGGYQTLMTNNARIAMAQRMGGTVPPSFTEKLELDGKARDFLTSTYYSYVQAFFTNDDLTRLNTLYSSEKGAILQQHEQQAYLALIDLHQDLVKRKLAKGLSAALQKVGEGQGENTIPGLTPLGKIGQEGER